MNVVSWVVLALITVGAAAAAGHALLSKRDPRAALGWIAVCLMFPLAGPALYFLFGFNRIRTRARKLQAQSGPRTSDGDDAAVDVAAMSVDDVPDEFRELARISDAVTGWPLVGGNAVELMHSGEQVYPAMLEAIERASKTLYLATYIFESNTTGERFVDALADAAGRGVDVRVMIDGVGELYSLPRASRLLSKAGVRVARFLPPKLIPPTVHINLRNHRKLMVVDGRMGFTGGMNIGDRHLAESRDNPARAVDAHFRVQGPVLEQLERVFLDDWEFVTGEETDSNDGPPPAVGGAICRGIIDGPDDDLDKLVTVMVGAVSAARERVAIMSPYFLPPPGLSAALQAAALRGVDVGVILPSQNNLPFVDWATRNTLFELLRWGVHVYYQPPPFVHSKLFIVDGHYAQIGSANIDPRSLRLNFEFAVEVYDSAFASTLGAHFESVRDRSRQVTVAEIEARPLPVKARDALAWLFSPYL